MPELTFTQFLILAVIIAIVWQILESAWKYWRTRRLGVGFQRYARDPDFRKMMMEDLERRLQAVEELKRDPDKIRHLLNEILNGENVEVMPGCYISHSLQKVGIVARSPLLEAIEDDRFVHNARLSGTRALGVQLIIDVVGSLRIAEAVPRILLILESTTSARIREVALGALAVIGSDDCLPPIRKALGAGADNEISRLVGVFAYSEQFLQTNQRFRSQLADDLIPMLGASPVASPHEFARALSNLDESRARHILANPEYLRKDHVNIEAIARALSIVKAKADPQDLRGLLDAYRADAYAEKMPEVDIYASLLVAYGMVEPRAALRLIAGAIQDTKCVIGEGLLECAAEIIEEAGAEAAGVEAFPTSREQDLLHYFDAEVCNGGLLQFFANPTGNDVELILETMKKWQAGDATKILESAMALFGSGGPAKDTESRSQQLARFGDRKIKKLEKLSEAYYALGNRQMTPRPVILRRILKSYPAV